jgi:hypothetical protein
MEKQTFDTIHSCRACGYEKLVDILDLGKQPLANSLLKQKTKSPKKYPLSTAFCPRCSLFQLKETIPKETLFDHYVWVTGTAKGTLDYAILFAERVIQKTKIKKGSLVLEIASNDGTILNQFLAHEMTVLGIEPAKNIAEIAVQNGIRTEAAYWDVDTAKKVIKQYGQPELVIARNVIPHVSELHNVIKGIALALSENGTGIIEFHSGAVIAEMLHYDSIYHEHLCYFTVHSLTQLLEQYGLHSWGADVSPISGGSIVLYFSKTKKYPEPEFLTLLKKEKDKSINNLVTWEQFGRDAIVHREKTLTLLKDLTNKKIVGFGASARSATFMNFSGIGQKQLLAVIDNNPIKQNLFTPAGDVPIVSFEQGMALKPELIFILAWNFKDEIIDQCKKQGFKGDYIIPFPQYPHIIRGD